MAKQFLYTAQCTCAQQAIHLSAPPVAQLVCHCADCQQATHQPFTAIAFFMPGDCQVAGVFKDEVMTGGSGYSKTYFSCAECNTCLYATVDVLKGMVGVVADKLAAPFEFAPGFHVWTSEKHSAIQLDGDTLQFAKGPPKPPHLM